MEFAQVAAFREKC